MKLKDILDKGIDIILLVFSIIVVAGVELKWWLVDWTPIWEMIGIPTIVVLIGFVLLLVYRIYLLVKGGN